MNYLDLEERLYTSTEVANILGVSLRSVYRYLEGDKLFAEIKTATGRHRFTKQNILDFLSPQSTSDKKPMKEIVTKKVDVPAPVSDEPAQDQSTAKEKESDVDWLSKFRAAAEKYKTEDEKPAPVAPSESVSGLADTPAEQPVEQPVEEAIDDTGIPMKFYKSGTGGLKDIAQNIDKSAKKASLEYAFTLDAGLSLHKPIKPFSVIHAYVTSADLTFFEKILDLVEVPEGDAQLCLIVSDEKDVYTGKREMHGLNVVADDKLKNDLILFGNEDLAKEL